MDRTLEFLSTYATKLTYDQLPPGVVHHVRRRVIDTLGCAMGGFSTEPSRIARSYALEVNANPGATVLGTRHRTAPDLAAFANGSWSGAWTSTTPDAIPDIPVTISPPCCPLPIMSRQAGRS